MGLNNPGGVTGAKIPLCSIINGDFETGNISPWLQYYGCGYLGIGSIDGAQGTYYAVNTTLGCGDAYFTFGMYQEIDGACASKKVKLWTRRYFSWLPIYPTLHCGIWIVSPGYWKYWSVCTITDTWTEYETTIPADVPASSKTRFIIFMAYLTAHENKIGKFDIDDVRIMD